MVENHYTISKTNKVYPSGGLPILVECEDLNTWVCKHGRLTSRLLLNELLASYFARAWGLNTPNYCLIEVSDEHLPIDNGIQPAFFKKHCFGSQFMKDAVLIDQTTIILFQNKSFRNKIENKSDYLKIAIFDIWLANEDRNPMHTNLLLDTSKKEYFFTVFDHDAIFNQITLGTRPLVLIDEECSLISGELSKLLFKRNKKLVNTVNEIVENFYLCVNKCREELPAIIDYIPESWGLSKNEIYKSLIDSIFEEQWIKNCEAYFRELVQKNI